MLNKEFIDIIGVPVDLGASRRGVDMGPSAIRYAGLNSSIEALGKKCFDKGNIEVPMPESMKTEDNEKLKNITAITKVNEKLFYQVEESLIKGHFTIILGGDHSLSAGSILGAQKVFHNIGVIWIDAHGDFNNEHITLSGNLHGMSLSAVTGFGPREMVSFKPEEVSFINPQNIALVGVRDIDKEEAKLLKNSGIHVFSMADIDMMGMKEVIARAIEVAEDGTQGFHLSFDLDAISPNEAIGVGTPVVGGLTYREAHLAVELISDRDKLVSAEVVELNPIMDEKNSTGILAVTLVNSILGKKVF
jgi:arginase